MVAHLAFSGNQNLAFSGIGAFLALTTGAIIGVGYGILQDLKEEKIVKKAIGSSILMLGLYAGSPVWLRSMFLYGG